ncbi:MAG: hypothetical protein Q4C42_00225 [Clostridia bacterium]|nr:hypothetical protein [Clostridia bacterium]
MPKLDAKELKENLKSGVIYPLYVLYGEEKFAVKLRTQELIKKFAPENFTEFNLMEFSSDSGIDTIADAALSLPFFADRKVIVVNDYPLSGKDAINETEYRKLEELLDNLSDMTVLIFAYPTFDNVSGKSGDSSEENANDEDNDKQKEENKKAKKNNWTKFLKKAEKVGAVVNYEVQNEDELIPMILSRVKANGSEISKYNAKKFLERIGNRRNVEVSKDSRNKKKITKIFAPLKLVYSEIDKICAFCYGREINESDIDLMIAKSLDEKVYEIVDAININNYSKAFDIIFRMLEAKEEPIRIVYTLSNNYIDMYRVRAAIESGLKPTEIDYDPKSYSKNTWRLDKIAKNSRGLTTDQLRLCLSACLETDALMKSSRADSAVLLEQLIAKIIMITKGENRSRYGKA